MATHRELIAYIRFQLDQLAATNAHHDFEHLCRHLARMRICSNILPATGPVSAGGDQGRDAESFRSYLANSPLASSTFVGLVSARPLAFACTIQKKDSKLKQKIKNDVMKIMASGHVVEGIHFFCAADIDVAFRHDLEAWASTEQNVELFIYDGQALSELLAAHDTFWIANEYLSVPSDLFPEDSSADAESWYHSLLTEWRGGNTPVLTFATFAEVKRALRHATFSPARQQDLMFWISKMRSFNADGVPPVLRYRAIYEVAVASLRGQGTMEGLEEDIRSYVDAVFNGTIGTDHVSDLEDASVLIAYCYGASDRHAVQVAEDEVRGWSDTLLSKLENQLPLQASPGQRCEILNILGYLMLLQELRSSEGEHRSAIEIWNELADLVESAPLFPLERFADFLTEFVPFMGDDPEFESLCRRIDELLAKRVGQFAAAEKCRDRALAFYKQGHILRASSELHQAKVKWLAEETLRGSILAMLFLSHCYSDLGLDYAAKYYAMAAAWLSSRSEKQEVRGHLAETLTIAAGCDYRLGNWRGFLQLTNVAMLSHWWFSSEAGDLNKHPELERVLFHTTVVLSVAENFDTDLFTSVRELVTTWGLDDDINSLLIDARKMWVGKDCGAVSQAIRRQLRGGPFDDLTSSREAVWLELGITWRVHWINDYRTTVAAEQLIATLQIAITDFARHDLLLLKTEVNIEVSVGEENFPKVDAVPSNEGRQWKVVLPGSQVGGEEATSRQEIALLAVTLQVLREASLLPDSDFMSTLEDVMDRGITGKVFVARSYGEIYSDMIPENAALESLALPLQMREHLQVDSAPPHPELVWADGPAPDYSPAVAHEVVAKRYAKIPARIPVTLARLGASEEFRQVVASLRAKGWKDWHILLAVGNLVWNFRLQQRSDRYSPLTEDLTSMKQTINEIMDDLSLESLSVVPLSEFAEEKLEWALDLSLTSTLKGLGLECQQQTPDIPAIREFLASRYNYWEDDVDHVDPFGPSSGGLLILPEVQP